MTPLIALALGVQTQTLPAEQVILDLHRLWKNDRGYRIELGEDTPSRAILARLDDLEEVPVVSGCKRMLDLFVCDDYYNKDAASFHLYRDILLIVWAYYDSSHSTLTTLSWANSWKIGDHPLPSLFEVDRDKRIKIKPATEEFIVPSFWVSTGEGPVIPKFQFRNYRELPRS